VTATSETTNATPATITADPPRFRRLKRWSVIGVVILFLLIGLRLWWGFEAQRRLDAMIAAAHARGELITIDDFNNRPAIPDAKNAAVALDAAGKSIKFSTTQDAFIDNFNDTLPIAPADQTALHEIVYANRAAIAQARQARPLTLSDYGMHLSSPIFAGLLRHLNDAGQLEHVQRLAVFDAHLAGNDTEAIEVLRDIDHHMNAVAKSTPFLATILFARYHQTMTADVIAQLAPELDVSGPSHSAATTQPAARENVRALIDELLDEREIQQSAQSAWELQRLMYLDAGPALAATMQPAWLAELLAPMYLLDSIGGAELMAQHRIAATQPNYPAAMKLAPLPARAGNRSGLEKTVSAISDRFGMINGEPHLSHFRLLAARRGAAIALAIRLYALDHNHRLPPRLEDLVPAYLSALPADPFRADGKTFTYHPELTPPRLYSVSVNGVDDGGVGRSARFFQDTTASSNSTDLVIPIIRATTQP
jgi:hypothetical protein